MLAIRNPELHVTHGCNLACESCSHCSDQGHKGLLERDEAAAWFAHWRDRIAPAEFSLLGGEPTINPALGDFVTLTRAAWPEARIRLVTTASSCRAIPICRGGWRRRAMPNCSSRSTRNRPPMSNGSSPFMRRLENGGPSLGSTSVSICPRATGRGATPALDAT
ncbi:MAG: radical SAM protein [Sphingomonadaceae bacterium]|nr:radical SAM protein [Sphingomonadaceae bacterium]